MKYTVHKTKPAGFVESVAVAACYIEFGGDYLFLKRGKGSNQPETWGVPAGKIKENEAPLDALIREVQEETSISLEKKSVQDLGKIWIDIPSIQYGYCLFHVRLDERPSVVLNHENQGFSWYKADEVFSLDLMMGAKEAFEYFLEKKPEGK